MAFYGQKNSGGNRKEGNNFTSKGRGFPQSSQKPPQQSHNQGLDAKDKPGTTYPNTVSKPILTCQICHKREHDALKCWHRFNHTYQYDDIPQALAAMNLSGTQDADWFPETGTTAYITDNPGKLFNLIPYKGTNSVMVGNGDFLKFSHIGYGIVHHGNTSIPLKNVLLVPNIKKSLLFVSQLTSDFPCYFEFNKSQFTIKNLMTKKVLASGSKCDGLYALDGQ
ncbi:hypothetical protein MRB53_009400 [Persea americana]|uniref:Uncharacterized protein n=1 Tax=Persea americana TaxID=3435 RepID=A0ACC2LPK8_PERAE|nr:hypothetical protein MRB53_009400 [Persea americana]